MRFTLVIATFSLAILSLGCSDKAQLRSDVPVSRSVATTVLVDVPLPASAHSIYYLMFGGGLQDLEFLVRFDVDPADLDAAVDSLVAWNNKQMSRALSYPRSPISGTSPPAPRKDFQPVSWWDPATISTGYYRGQDDAWALRIFVDQARSRIYMWQNN